ncbi:MAG: amidase [Alphaproteobacteria bacterium]
MGDDRSIAFLSIAQASERLAAGALTAERLVAHMIERIDGVGRALNCFTALTADAAMAAARESDGRRAAGRCRGPLDGIPIALKDNIDLAGVPTSNGFGGSPWRIPAEDAEAVRRLKAAGAIILGKLNMQEGALGAASDNAHFGFVINPYRPGRSPGGSSGGSGAAVAAGLCCAALGTDTGGSIRIPASYCGVVGLKASYGLVSTRGVVPLSYSLDHIGPLARTVGDAALLLDAMRGFDPACTESRRRPLPALDATAGRLDGLRLGIVRTFDEEPADPAVAAAFAAAQDRLRTLGAEVVPVEMPGYRMVAGRRAGFVRVEVEAAFIRGALYREAPDRFSPAMQGFLDFGLRATAQQSMRADRTIAVGAFALERCFEGVDLLLSPTTPQAAFAFDGAIPENAGTYTIPANYAGIPAISIPMGCDPQGMPLGLQIMAPLDAEPLLLRAAAAFEGVSGAGPVPPAPYGPVA